LGVVPQAAELAPGFSVLETALAGRFAVMGGRVFENDDDLAAAQSWPWSRPASGSCASAGRASFPAANASAWPWPGRFRPSRAYCSWTSPPAPWTWSTSCRVMGMLERACRHDGLAVCLVSHDLNLASLYCNSLLLLAQGKPLAMGAPAGGAYARAFVPSLQRAGCGGRRAQPGPAAGDLVGFVPIEPLFGFQTA
jgi:iron complex transport system ATP-binding protein